MFSTIARLFARKLTARQPAGFKPGLTALEARDCPAGYPNAGGTGYSNVTAPLFAAGGPKFTDIQQGQEGDCWLLAGLAEVAARSPGEINSMFTYRGTASAGGATTRVYDVRLYDTGGTARAVRVDAMLPAGGRKYESTADGVLWPALVEKAYAQANGAGLVHSSNPRQNSYAALDGGNGAWAVQAVTGRRADTGGFNGGGLAAAWNAGKFITIGTYRQPSSPAIEGRHEYAVVGYTPGSSTPFTVYNPWGTNASGMVPGSNKWGLFRADAGFLGRNFDAESVSRAEHDGRPADADGGTAADFATPAGVVRVTAGEPTPARPAAGTPTPAADTPARSAVAAVTVAMSAAAPGVPAAADAWGDAGLGVWVG